MLAVARKKLQISTKFLNNEFIIKFFLNLNFIYYTISDKSVKN